MRFLAIDTANALTSICLVQEELDYHLFDQPMQQVKLLLPKIAELLIEKCLSIEQLDFLAVTLGPGSFTGSRIGLSTAKALALPHQLPVIGASTLEIVANQAPEGKVMIMLDASRRQYYCQIFENNRATSEIKLLTEEEAKQFAEQFMVERIVENMVPNAKLLAEYIISKAPWKLNCQQNSELYPIYLRPAL